MSRYSRKAALYLSLAAALLSAASTVLAAAADAQSPDTVFSVYLSPTGSDSNDGLTSAHPLKTLVGAQAVLQSAGPVSDVDVLIADGTYVADPTAWTFRIPGHSITFEPETVGTQPVFEGTGAAGFWFKYSLPNGDNGGDVNLVFNGLKIEHYASGGIYFRGALTPAPPNGIITPANVGVNHNTIENMVFEDLGSSYVPNSSQGYGGVDTQNSSNNTIINNEFSYFEDSGSSPGLIHGVYIADYSQDDSITDNTFSHIAGDPVRFRDRSNDNTVDSNTFYSSGHYGYASDWFNLGTECASLRNLVQNNEADVGFYGTAIPWAAYFGVSSPTGDGGGQCGNGGVQRIITLNNTTL